VEELRGRGIEIFIKDKLIDNTPEGKFVFNILGAVAEFEKEKILERTRRGRLCIRQEIKVLWAIFHLMATATLKRPQRKKGNS